MAHGVHMPMAGIAVPTTVPRQEPVRSTVQPTILSAGEVGGIATCELPAPPSGFVAFVTYVSLETTSTSAATCSFKVNGFQVDYADQVSDAATEYRGLYVGTGETLELTFSGLSAGSTASARLVWALVPASEAAMWLGGVR